MEGDRRVLEAMVEREKRVPEVMAEGERRDNLCPHNRNFIPVTPERVGERESRKGRGGEEALQALP